MVLRIDTASDVPVYRQIVDGLRIALVNGELSPGDSLPPVRRLALDLGVHFNTVAQAYRALAQEGWLEISARGGACVQERSTPAAAKPEASTAFRRRIEELIAQMLAHGVSRARLARELQRVADNLKG
jgi:DNA-binding transcriptional regulator YhcF (GntR family)